MQEQSQLIMFELEKYKKTIYQLCKKYNVKSLHLFGSALSEKFNYKSDIDLLVKFNDIAFENYFDNFISLKSNLEIIFDRKIDLLEEQSLHNPILIRSVNRDKLLIYG